MNPKSKTDDQDVNNLVNDYLIRQKWQKQNSNDTSNEKPKTVQRPNQRR